jgi:arylsulfatase A-like enzyme
VRPGDVTLPPGFHATPTNPPPPLQFLRAQRQAQPGFKPAYGSFACSEQEAREAIALNHGNLACIDNGVGRVLGTLRRLGLENDTVVMFTADHGDLMGERGLLFKGGLHYGALTRVPFIWRDPARPAAQPVSQALAQTIDIPATVLERAGITPTNGMQGRSLLPVMDGSVAAVRDALLIEEESQRRDFGLDRRVRMRTLRTATHRCTLWHGQDWGELVDLQEDPLELHNLWDEPQAQGVRQHMVEQLVQTMLQGADDSPYPGAAA